MTDADEFLEDDDVEQFQTDDQYDHAAAAVLDKLAEELQSADTTMASVSATGAATDALATLVSEASDPEAVVQRAKDECGDLARRSGKTKDRLIDLIDDATQEILDEHRQNQLGDGEGLAVPEGVGLDTYLEEDLIEIVRQQSTDAVDDPVLRWRFEDGVRIETSESVHHDYYALFKKLASATDKRLVPELASEGVEDELRDEEDTDGEAYARLSLGPTSRPWHTDNALWSRAISGLVQERARTETVVGPRTDAFESIQARLRSGRAVEDLTDAVEHGMIYVDDDADEVWIPTTMVDNAADQVETSRRALQAELAERGVTSSSLSGERVSEAISRGATATRFWRLDSDHGAVPEPETVLEEIADPVEQADVDGDDAAATDGGTGTGAGSEPQGTEVFGRPPDPADGDTTDKNGDPADETGEENADTARRGDPPDDEDAGADADADTDGGGE